MRMTEGQDKLIQSVKARPVLYSRYHPQFTDRKLKLELWYEVCAETTPNWSEMSCGKRGEVVQEVQRRWKTLRDGFSRELVFQKQDRMKRAKGEIVRQRKKYTFFEKLKFLLKQKKKEGAFDENAEGQEENESDSNQSEGSNRDDSVDEESAQTPKVEPGPSSFYVDVGNIDNKAYDNQTQSSFAGAEAEKTVDDDEDKLFCLSLVPGFKKMTEKQKYEARIRIMQVLSEIRFKNNEPLVS